MGIFRRSVSRSMGWILGLVVVGIEIGVGRGVTNENPWLIPTALARAKGKDVTPLHGAARAGVVGEVEALLDDTEADVNAHETRHGWTPLHVAFAEGHLNVGLVLIAHGANIHTTDHTMHTPLDLLMSHRLVDAEATAKERDAWEKEREMSGRPDSGFLYTCGSGANMCLGCGSADQQLSLHKVESLPVNVSSGVCSKYHAAAITTTGSVFTWGMGTRGRLGHGCEDVCMLPRQIDSLRSYHVVQVAVGLAHTLAIAAPGVLFSWGENEAGQLGYHQESPQLSPRKVLHVRERIVSVAAGHVHSIVVADTGDVMTWGSNRAGQLGYDTASEESVHWYPRRVPFPDKRIVQVAAGGESSVSITNHGSIYVWGEAKKCTPSRVVPVHDREEQRNVGGFVTNPIRARFVAASAGHGHFAAITDRGILYTWGSNERGQLGVEETPSVPAPRKVPALAKVCIVRISCGAFHTLAVSGTGELYAWGSGLAGRLGIGCEDDMKRPFRVDTLRGVVGVGGGDQNSLIVVAPHKVVGITLPPSSYAADLRDMLWKGGRFADVELWTKKSTQALMGHKFVVAARCRILARKLAEAKQTEPRTRLVLNSDANDCVLKKFMEFIYCGMVEECSSAMVGPLRSLAGEYSLPKLVKICRAFPDGWRGKSDVLSVITEKEEEEQEQEQEQEPAGRPSSMRPVSRVYGSLLRKPMYSDLEVRVSDGQDAHRFHVHRAILCARCDVFRAMLLSPMSESMQGIVEIKDMNTSTAHRLLTYLYTDETDVIGAREGVLDLLQTADVYLLPRLKATCETAAAHEMDIHSVVPLIKIAGTLNAHQLREFCLNYMLDHVDNLIASGVMIHAPLSLREEVELRFRARYNLPLRVEGTPIPVPSVDGSKEYESDIPRRRRVSRKKSFPPEEEEKTPDIEEKEAQDPQEVESMPSTSAPWGFNPLSVSPSTAPSLWEIQQEEMRKRKEEGSHRRRTSSGAGTGSIEGTSPGERRVSLFSFFHPSPGRGVSLSPSSPSAAWPDRSAGSVSVESPDLRMIQAEEEERHREGRDTRSLKACAWGLLPPTQPLAFAAIQAQTEKEEQERTDAELAQRLAQAEIEEMRRAERRRKETEDPGTTPSRNRGKRDTRRWMPKK